MLEQTCSSLPYGDALSCTGGDLDAPTEHHFTGKERDAESGNDYFEARYYASSMGRFMSPDWSAKAEPVPYAKLGDPQTLNLYAYVGNNPMTRFDADGHNAAGGNDDSKSEVAIIIKDRHKDSSGNYDDDFTNLKHQKEFNAEGMVFVNGELKEEFLMKTTPDDAKKYATTLAGIYEAKRVMHKGKYAAIGLIGTTGDNTHVPTLGPNPSRGDKRDIASDIHGHKAGLDGEGYARNGGPVSMGCLTVYLDQYSDFQAATGIVPTAGTPQQSNIHVYLGTSANSPQQTGATGSLDQR